MNIDRLIGSRFQYISRAADMMCLGLGDEIDIVNYKGEIEKRPEYAIHFQCPWRFLNESSIVLGSYDIYEPYNKKITDDWEYNTVAE